MKVLLLNCRRRAQVAARILVLVVFSVSLSTGAQTYALQQSSITQLEAKLNSQYAAIQKTFTGPPNPAQYSVPEDYRRHLRKWQDDLAQTFVVAATTVREILKLNPPNADYWQDRLETLDLYSQPISSPEQRSVYGASEVQRTARLIHMPTAQYTDEARAARVHGDVRLRMVLAADGKVRNVFPIKSLPHGLTESAMNAARQIEFQAAIRNGNAASQFITLVYEFKDGQSRPPYVPRTIF